ncbi:MAG: M14 family metallopeptidase, partial [Candidatus Bathyarchaeia archaeon]
FRIVSPEGEDVVELENPLRVEKGVEVSKAVYEYRGERIVQWEKPISPEECQEIISKLDAFPEVTAYRVGQSYLGREVWAMDVMLPVKAGWWSQAKASAYKPVLLLTGRQHANEISSTSHILRLVELLITDPEYKKFLKRVNLVVNPISNVDGATLGCELYELTPRHMLHAARLGSLGVDVSAGQWDRDPIYPESRVLPRLWRTWLPDIYLNPHGYPSHEWVQLFAGYAGWVQSRLARGGRSWWIPRGWFMPGFSYVEDPRFPRHKEVAFAIRDYIVEGINGAPGVKAMNERMYARRRRYGAFDPEVYKENLYRGVMIPAALRGMRKNPAARSFMARYPEITVFSGSTEAPDETASGDWLELVCTAGLAFDLAHLRFLYDSQYEVKRYEGEWRDCVSFSVERKRPVLPPNPSEGEVT